MAGSFGINVDLLSLPYLDGPDLEIMNSSDNTYWQARGNMTLSSSRFSAIVNASKGLPTKNFSIKLSSGKIGTARVVDFYSSSEYSLVLGKATIYYNNKGLAVGFYNKYDFDSKEWGARSVTNELKTRAVNAAGNYSDAKPFVISYGIGVNK